MRKKRRLGEILSVVLVAGILVIAGVAVLVMSLRGSVVRDTVTLEAGAQTLSPTLFVNDALTDVRFYSDVARIDLDRPGTYKIQLMIKGSVYDSCLLVVDTTAPTAEACEQEIGLSDVLEPEAFVTNVQDVSPVTVTFKTEPAFGKEGTQDVTLQLADESGNTAEVRSRLTVSRVRKTTVIDVEADAITPGMFLLEKDPAATLLTDAKALQAKGMGDYVVQVQTGGKTYDVVMQVTDSTPPEATPVDVRIWPDITEVKPTEFVKDIHDSSKVTTTFVVFPVYGTPGEQTVTVQLEDAYGNRTTYDAKLTVAEDDVPPTLTGVGDLEVYQGETVSYKKGVTATDDKDGKVSFAVDSHDVDLEKVGTYTVLYTASDKAGNSTKVKRTVYVREKPRVSEEKVKELAQSVLRRIVNDSMTKAQKLEAVYNWSSRSVGYINMQRDADWLDAAYYGFTLHRGDCFRCYAVTKVLLDECGIDNMMVKRVETASTNHYWLLVNVGTGWYHLDTTPHLITNPFRCFMKTDQEIWNYAKGRRDRRYDYYDFDTELYPARATKPYEAH